jgi:glucuronate isomerase
MPRRLQLHQDRLFPADPTVRAIARSLYASVRDLPIISPHGHTDPAWFATNEPFTNATDLFIAPDHYLYRMLYSQGTALKDLRVEAGGERAAADPRAAWKLFARNFHLFSGTPSWLWLSWVFQEVFRFEHQLGEETADAYFDAIGAALHRPEFRPRALFERFRIEVIATTEGPNDSLGHHRALRESGWKGRVITTYRPDPVVDPEHPDFRTALPEFGELTKQDVHGWRGYLEAHRIRREFFRRVGGATATDHGHPSPRTADLSTAECEALFAKVVAGKASPADAELFRGQMLVEMARMSLEDGLVMQIHPGAFRNHNARVFEEFGRDKGADIPVAVDYVHGLKPLLDRFGNDKRLSVIVFTLDESTYSRELAPLAGHYPVLKLGPAWWFHDSPEGMMRFREQTTETAGFYNTVGFNDDTRAFLSIPARHDVARRIDCSFLARLVAEHRLEEEDAQRIATDLAYRLPKQAYKL